MSFNRCVGSHVWGGRPTSHFALQCFIDDCCFRTRAIYSKNLAVANRSRVSCINTNRSHNLATSGESRRYVVVFTRVAGGGIWLRQESLRHILASHGHAPEKIVVNVTWMERGFNAGQTPRCIPIYLQPFLRYSNLLVENCDIFIPHLCL